MSEPQWTGWDSERGYIRGTWIIPHSDGFYIVPFRAASMTCEPPTLANALDVLRYQQPKLRRTHTPKIYPTDTPVHAR